MSEGSLGFMLQGVSQQPDNVQPDGHVRSQINMLPDPNRGLTSRPGSENIALFAASGGIEPDFNTVMLRGNLFDVVTDSLGDIRVLAYTGVEWPVVDKELFTSYFTSPGIRAVSTEEGIYILNKSVVVAGANSSPDVMYEWGYAYSLGGQFSRTYRLRLRYADNTVAVGTFTVPDGDVPGDAEQATAVNIITQLRTSLMAHANFKVTTTVTQAREYLSILDSATTFEVLPEDGENNSVLRGGVSRADTFADVPKYAPHNAVVRVVGEIGSTVDDVWLKFVSDTETVTGNGFGNSGIWVETVDPAAAWEFDLDTMPHLLVPDFDTQSFTARHGPWVGREVGSEDTAPIPSFVGSAINDIGEFSSRFFVLAGNSWSTTQTAGADRLGFSRFFRKTAQEDLASDPIDLTASGEEDSNLLFGVSYDKSLVVFSQTAQFFIEGGQAVTPNTAAMPRTTKFETSGRARPTVGGDLMMFPFRSLRFSGVNEIRPSSSVQDNYIDDTTKVTPKYIEGEITQLVSAGNAKTLVARTDINANRLYVYNFLWNGSEKIQSAWHMWQFEEEILNVHMFNSVLYLWTFVNGNYRLSSIRLDKPNDQNIPYHASMDWKRPVSAFAEGGVVLEHERYSFIAQFGNMDYEPGRPVTPVSITETVDGWEYVFGESAPEDLLGGVVFETEVTPARPKNKTFRGAVETNSLIIVTKYVVDYTESGRIDVYNQSKYLDGGEEFIMNSEYMSLDDNPLDNFGTTISDGTFGFPWGHDQLNSKLVLRSATAQPVTYVEVRWYGNTYKNRR